MVECPDCESNMEIEERKISFVIGFSSIKKTVKVAICSCGTEILLTEMRFSGETLTIEETENGPAHRWN